ncbi:DNA polymerase III subunit delta' [Alteromonas sp. a30]|uniref:DNA polymerase III subunit delta' n=1 Tax=Alteromonas sp. a30 TaxID=2730917 RepID=UPI00227F0233|nr:DNA polymerase III subunit delta' [Alteromonas sp. a30]MCY7294057.1 DNA polymerase III subunit delta' [Alteromonas sp. a30]
MVLPWLVETYSQLTTSRNNNTLHHAIILHGKEGVGKQLLVEQFAQDLLCQQDSSTACGQCKSCQLFLAQSHPDFHKVVPENQIGVDDIRAATNRLNSASHQMQAKVLMITSAHKMTVAAANSLLKTLEEPTAKTYLFLLTDKMDSLLPTIKSRCHKQNLGVAKRALVEQWLQSEGITADPILLDLYWYRPLYLKRLLSDPDANQLKDIEQDFDSVLAGQLTTLAFTDKYLECVDLCLEWLQLYFSEQMKGCDVQNQDAHWEAHIQLTQLSRQLALPGVNKSLLLNQALSALLEAVKQS